MCSLLHEASIQMAASKPLLLLSAALLLLALLLLETREAGGGGGGTDRVEVLVHGEELPFAGAGLDGTGMASFYGDLAGGGRGGTDRVEVLVHGEELPFAGAGLDGTGMASFYGDLAGGMQLDGIDDVMRAWYIDDDDDNNVGTAKEGDSETVPLAKLRDLGVIVVRLDADNHEQDQGLKMMRQQRGYLHMDMVELTPEKLPNYDSMIKRFFEEHLHADEEVRYCLEGSGYFDVRDEDDRWVQVSVTRGALMVLPAGMYHRFTLDSNKYIKAMRLFSGGPDWTAYNRPHDHLPARKQYLASLHALKT